MALPFVGIPSLIGGILLAGPIVNALKIQNPDISNLLVFVTICLTLKVLSRLAGRILVSFRMLPPGSARYYPNAGSWEKYVELGRKNCVSTSIRDA